MSNFSRRFVAGSLVTPVIVAVCAALSFGQGNDEEATADRIRKAAGVAIKEKGGGHINVIDLRDLSDDFVNSIDFSVFPRLKHLAISEPGSGGRRSLIPLLRVPSGLTALDIEDAQIDGKELAALLKKQKSLPSLRLRGKEITDRVLADGQVDKAESLIALRLDNTSITDTGLKQISKLTELGTLDLGHTKITDNGLKNLAGLRRIFNLSLEGDDVSDAGLAHLKGLDAIRMLNLKGTGVTDKVVEQLGGLSKLATLGVSSTKVTEKGKKRLQELLPDAQID